MASTTRKRAPVIVIGGGHNGLVCACYLARAGIETLVLERAPRAGGATQTVESFPGFFFDTHAVAHNMINMTTIPRDLELERVGLVYREMDPFTTAYSPAGPPFRMYRSVARTCDDLARTSVTDARLYRDYIRAVEPLTRIVLASMRAGSTGARLLALPGQVAQALRALRGFGARGLAATLLAPYQRLLDELLPTPRVQAAVAALAAHATVGPAMPGGSFYAMWQSAYHLSGMWHPLGGSGALAEALVRRLQAWGGQLRTRAGVRRIEVRNGRAAGVTLDNGETIAATAVVAAINPKIVLLELLAPNVLAERMLRRARALHTGNAVQFVTHLALNRLPECIGQPGADAWNGMQAFTRDVGQVARAFALAEAGFAPDDPPVYAFAPSAIDPALAPPGKHGLYLACPCYPARFADGTPWSAHAERELERLIAAAEPFIPDLRQHIIDAKPRTPEDAEREIGLVGGHPMHLDLTLDQLLVLRPLPGLAGHRTPLPGLYLSGAGTNPAGGVIGAPGRDTARAVLRDLRHRP